MKKQLLFFLITLTIFGFLSTPAFSYTGLTVLRSTGQQKLLVRVNGLLINRFPSQEVRFQQFAGRADFVEVRLIAPSGRFIELKKSVLALPGRIRIFQLRANRFGTVELVAAENYPLNSRFGGQRPGNQFFGDDCAQQDDFYSDQIPPQNQFGGHQNHGNFNQTQNNCEFIISQQDLQNIKEAVGGQSFEQTKLTLAKQALNRKSYLAEDVAEIMLLFEFESSKLEFAKWAYRNTCDKENYFMVNSSFNFESSVLELDRWINNR